MAISRELEENEILQRAPLGRAKARRRETTTMARLSRTTEVEAADRKSPGRAEAAAPGEPAPKRGKKIRLPRSSDRYVFLKVVESIVPAANGLCMYDGKLFV